MYIIKNWQECQLLQEFFVLDNTEEETPVFFQQCEGGIEFISYPQRMGFSLLMNFSMLGVKSPGYGKVDTFCKMRRNMLGTGIVNIVFQIRLLLVSFHMIQVNYGRDLFNTLIPISKVKLFPNGGFLKELEACFRPGVYYGLNWAPPPMIC